ncbi:unnamed protein product, partial [Rotaria sp. Silwood2]
MTIPQLLKPPNTAVFATA